MVLYVFGVMGSPPLCMGATVFIVHYGGKPSARAGLKIRVRKGTRHSRAYMMCSTHNHVWSMNLLCCNFFMTFVTLEVVKSVPKVGQGVEGIGMGLSKVSLYMCAKCWDPRWVFVVLVPVISST